MAAADQNADAGVGPEAIAPEVIPSALRPTARGRSVDRDGDGRDDVVYYGWDDNGDGKPDGPARAGKLVDIDDPDFDYLPIPKRRKRVVAPSKDTILKYSSKGTDFEVALPKAKWWRRVERYCWIFVSVLLVWASQWFAPWLYPAPKASAALLEEMVTTPNGRDRLDDEMVDRAVRAIEKDTGKRVKPLE